MLKTALALIVFLIFAVWLGIVLGQDPGLATFSWGNTRVETPLWFAACGLLFILFLVWQLSRLFGVFPHAFYRLKNWRETRRLHHQAASLRDGLMDLFEQRLKKAEQRLQTVGPAVTDLHPVGVLGAAYAAHRLGEFKRRDRWLMQANNVPAAKLLQADFCLDEKKPEDVIVLLSPLRKNPAALIRLQKAYRRLGQWKSLLAVIPEMRKASLLSAEKAGRLARKAAQNWLAGADSAEYLQIIWQELPRALRQEPRVIRTYITHLLYFPGTEERAFPLITSAISRQFDPKLIRLYGETALTDAKKQLLQAEKWLKTHDADPALLLTLGQIALRCRLWGKARGYLNDCLVFNKNNTRAHALLGWLDEQAGDTHAALARYRAGLHIKHSAEPVE